jgi:hypothetical protein
MSKGSCILLCMYAVLLAGCGRSEARDSSESAGRVVDSLVPREVALDRFRASLAVTDSLTGGAHSRDDLVRAYLTAIEKSDTAAFDRLVLTKAEFAYLYYPTAPQALPPYNLSPDLMWFMLFERSNQGVLRALRHYGGQRMELVDAECGTAGSREGENTVFGPCTVRWHDAKGQVSGARLFSQIVERRGRYKFLSYANKL